MFCKNCGAQVEPDAVFCQNCGKQLVDEQANAQASQDSSNDFSKASAENNSNAIVKNISESMKKSNSKCIAGAVIFAFGMLFLRHSLIVMAFAFFVSLSGYSEAKKKNQSGRTIGLVALTLSGIMCIVILMAYGTAGGLLYWLGRYLR